MVIAMNQQVSMDSFIKGIPKAELHLHIEGTFESELMFAIARRNDIELEYGSAEELKATYDFKNLADFLRIYDRGVHVLRIEQDFYDLTFAYLKKAHSQNILHTEVSFDPQAHTERKRGPVDFETVITGIHRALTDAEEKLRISTGLIMCFHRDKTRTSAMKTLEEALPYKSWIMAVGLDSYEKGFPPKKFKAVFERAHEEGWLAVAHAGEEGPVKYIRQAVNLLKVHRIDHGIRLLDDKNLVQELIIKEIPLTICPLSNLKLRLVDRMENHPLKEMMEKKLSVTINSEMMEKKLLVTINSDDPAYFGGYINENYLAIQKALKLDKEDIYNLAKNSFVASFLDTSRKQEMIAELDEYKSRNSYENKTKNRDNAQPSRAT